ncbi:right-handed parallel beta-helix repeat-containing protein [Nonomuraea sp. NPDC050556]|uniref:right-handed parallel beta-helix repeat-containing protein n=1 Tax=Nonomuraea sp. NPDC050556 TaxID=3364369 RepID=UPI003797038E
MRRLPTALLASAAVLAATGLAVTTLAAPANANRVDATCTNAAGDAAVLQAAIDSSKEGDEVVFKGPCLLTATLSLPPRRTYRGDGKMGTFIKQADGANLPAMLASEGWVKNAETSDDTIRIERMTLDGNRDANTGTVGLMLRAWNARVYDMDIYGAPSDGIRISNPSQNGTLLRNTMVNSVISDVDIEGSAEAGIRVVDPGNSVTDWTLQRAWIGFNGTNAIQMDNAAGWTLSELHLYATPKNAIDAHRCFGTSISNNYIEDFGAESTKDQTYYGIRCDLQGDAATTITGNRIHKFLPPPNGFAELKQAFRERRAPVERKVAATGPLPDGVNFVYMALDNVNYGWGHAAISGNTIVGHGTKQETGIQLKKGEGEKMSVASAGNLVDGAGVPISIGPGVKYTRGY